MPVDWKKKNPETREKSRIISQPDILTSFRENNNLSVTASL